MALCYSASLTLPPLLSMPMSDANRLFTTPPSPLSPLPPTAHQASQRPPVPPLHAPSMSFPLSHHPSPPLSPTPLPSHPRACIGPWGCLTPPRTPDPSPPRTPDPPSHFSLSRPSPFSSSHQALSSMHWHVELHALRTA